MPDLLSLPLLQSSMFKVQCSMFAVLFSVLSPSIPLKINPLRPPIRRSPHLVPAALLVKASGARLRIKRIEANSVGGPCRPICWAISRHLRPIPGVAERALQPSR